MWANWSYCDPNFVKAMGHHNVKCHHDKETDATAYTFYKEKHCTIIAFRGTESLRDVRMDLSVWTSRYGDDARVHTGFLKQWQGLKRSIILSLNGAQGFVFLCGHSLGGAVACLAGCDLGRHFQYTPSKLKFVVTTFGSPRVGNAAFVEEFRQNVYSSLRVVRKPDPVPLLPPLFYYKHPECQSIRFDKDNNSIPPSEWEGVCSRWGLTFLNVIGACFGLRTRPSQEHSMKKYIKCFQ